MQHDIPFEEIPIYELPPSPTELQAMARAHDQGISALISTRGRAYQEMGLADRTLSDDEWLAAIVGEPRLLRRPILWDGQRLLVGWNRNAYEAIAGKGGAV